MSTGQHSSNLLDSLTNQLTQVQSELADTKRQLRQKQALPADLQIAHDLERSMQRRIDKLSAELEAANISGQKYESSAEELADLKQKLAGVESGKSALDARLQRDADALSPDLSERRVRSQYHKARAARYRQERETLQETQSLAQPAQEKLMRELHVMKSNEATLDARLKSLMQERAEAQATIKRLRNAKDAQGSSQGTFSLDSFRDAVDQVSEAHVSFTGHPSVERLNEAIDNMVLEVLEQACEALAAHGDSITHFDVKPPPLDTPLFASLAKPSLTEDNRGFLLDALLHNLIVPFVYDMFFQRTISTIAVDDEVEVLDKVFSKITAAGMTLSPFIATLSITKVPEIRALGRLSTVESNDSKCYCRHVQTRCAREASGSHRGSFFPIYRMGLRATSGHFSTDTRQVAPEYNFRDARRTSTIPRPQARHSLCSSDGRFTPR